VYVASVGPTVYTACTTCMSSAAEALMSQLPGDYAVMHSVQRACVADFLIHNYNQANA
jgi:hypothetical protein